ALGVKVWVLPGQSTKVTFADFRARCAAEGITGVFFEGGAQLLSEALQMRELDYLFTYHAPVLFADEKGKGILRGLRTETLDHAIRLTQVRHEVLGDDSLMRGFVKYPEKMFVDEATFTRKLYGQ
ncbi:MAG TPA: dihydrofolate reductase family protein, partial [Lacunisphaera sp.]|nr:dihydrofolate reductase family protein [Lacunisphaera sp.]